MPLIRFPISKVSFPIFPLIGTKSLFHIHVICPLILLTSVPGINPPPMHFALKPVSFVAAAVAHLQSAFSMKSIVFPLTLVDTAIFHIVLSPTLFDSWFIIAFVRATILPNFFTFTLGLIPHPIPLIFLSILIYKSSITIRVIIHPLSFIYVPIGLFEFTKTPCAIFLPFPLVFRSVKPDLSPFAFSKIVDDLTIINCSIAESYDLSSTGCRRKLLFDYWYILKPAALLQFVVLQRLRYCWEHDMWSDALIRSSFIESISLLIT